MTIPHNANTHLGFLLDAFNSGTTSTNQKTCCTISQHDLHLSSPIIVDVDILHRGITTRLVSFVHDMVVDVDEVLDFTVDDNDSFLGAWVVVIPTRQPNVDSKCVLQFRENGTAFTEKCSRYIVWNEQFQERFYKGRCELG